MKYGGGNSTSTAMVLQFFREVGRIDGRSSRRHVGCVHMRRFFAKINEYKYIYVFIIRKPSIMLAIQNLAAPHTLFLILFFGAVYVCERQVQKNVQRRK